MNLRDDEWEPEPTDQHLLRKIRAAANSTVSTHDLAKLRTDLLSSPFNGAIPHEIRGTIWLLLLNLRSEDLLAEDATIFAQTARQSVKDDNSKEQIEKDVQRTRPGLSRFKQPAVRGALLRLLSLFCEKHKVTYVQGLNELLAPFILLADTGSNPRIAYALFSSFVARFAPWTLESSEIRMFDTLKRLFKYFERLLLYHDPELYWLLENHSMTPDLYATSWFITLFSRNFTIESVLTLWDLLLLEDDPLGTSFFAIALLRSKRDDLLSIDESRIPETLMLLTAGSPDEIRRLWKIGSDMRVLHTPPSFQRLMTDRILLNNNNNSSSNRNSSSTNNSNTNSDRKNLLNPNIASAAKFMHNSVCLQTTPDDLVAGDSQYFTWDCRTKQEFDGGHLAQAAYLPLDYVRGLNGNSKDLSNDARSELHHASDLCEQLKGTTHICLVGSGIHEEDKNDVNVLAMYLTRLGIPYVSTLRGGFEETLHVMKNNDGLTSVELVDFDRRKHDQARRTRISAQKRRNKQNANNFRRNPAEFTSRRMDSLSSADVMKQKGENSENTSTGITSFLEKTDAEVSNVLSKALAGIGLNYAFSGHSDASIDREEIFTSPKAIASNSSMPPMTSPMSSATTSGGDTPSRAASAGLRSSNIPASSGIATSNIDDITKKWSSTYSGISIDGKLEDDTNREAEKTGVEINENEINMNKNEGQNNGQSIGDDWNISSPSTVTSMKNQTQQTQQNQQQTDQNSSTSRRRNMKKMQSNYGGIAPNIKGKVSSSPWMKDAKPGWLSKNTLKYPLSAMPAKGFTVNMMDEQVMNGLRLFPCKAKSDQSKNRNIERVNEFKRRYVGVSRYYLFLLGPYQNRNHLLEVKMIRYLQDIDRITFKRSRPELVTFSISISTKPGEGEGGDDKAKLNERVVCIMPDGLKECVELIRNHIAGDLREENNIGTAKEHADSADFEKSPVDRYSSERRRRDAGGDVDKDNTGNKGQTSETENDRKPVTVKINADEQDDDFGDFQSAPKT